MHAKVEQLEEALIDSESSSEDSDEQLREAKYMKKRPSAQNFKAAYAGSSEYSASPATRVHGFGNPSRDYNSNVTWSRVA